jgi:hypothetical protein
MDCPIPTSFTNAGKPGEGKSKNQGTPVDVTDVTRFKKEVAVFGVT